MMSHDRRPRSEATWYNGSRKGRSVDNCICMGGAFNGCFTEDSRFRIPAVRGLPVSPRRRALRRKPVPRMPHDGNPPVVLRFARLWQELAASRRRRGNAREAYEVKDRERLGLIEGTQGICYSDENDMFKRGHIMQTDTHADKRSYRLLDLYKRLQQGEALSKRELADRYVPHNRCAMLIFFVKMTI